MCQPHGASTSLVRPGCFSFFCPGFYLLFTGAFSSSNTTSAITFPEFRALWWEGLPRNAYVFESPLGRLSVSSAGVFTFIFSFSLSLSLFFSPKPLCYGPFCAQLVFSTSTLIVLAYCPRSGQVQREWVGWPFYPTWQNRLSKTVF